MFRVIKLIASTTVALLTFTAIAARSEDVKPDNENKQKPLPWSKKPVKEWPQFVLTNEAKFKGRSPLKGASSFLMRMSDDDMALVTARHLIGKEGGVEPPVGLTEFDDVFTRWDAFPRTKPELRVTVKGIAMAGNAGERQDWLLLHLKDPGRKLPATPLQPRTRRAETGDVAFLIGVPYSDAKSAQNVYKGKVTKRPSRNYFELEFEPAVKLAGFSGAPVVDKDGYLLGMMTTSPESKRKDGLQTICWCQDIAVGKSLWKKKDAPTSSKAESDVQLKLPPGWTEKPSTAKNVVICAEYEELDASFQLQAFSAKNVNEVMSLKEWAMRNKDVQIGANLDDRKETESTLQKIGVTEVYAYDVSGKINGMAIRYRMITFERNKCFCNLLCWTFEENWSKAQPKFEDVFKAVK